MGVVREQKEVKLGTSQRIQGILTGIVDEYPLENIPLNNFYSIQVDQNE